MRLRSKKWVKQFLIDNEKYILKNDEPVNGYSIFKNENKIILEIGSGKGNFICSKALQNPQYNYIALEKVSTVAAIGIQWCLKEFNAAEKELNNLRYVIDYVEKYEKNIPNDSVSRIYLNYSDPWPKARHAKYRLTGRKYLKIYDRILTDEGEIHIKTDSDNLYKFTLDESIFSNFKVILAEKDLYNNPELMKDNVSSSYEQKFVAMGMPIKKIILRKKKPTHKKEVTE